MDQKDMEKPSYWAVIPASVRYDQSLTPGARLLYAEISALTDALGYCFASNAYFRNLYGIAEETVRRYLKQLKDSGYITIVDGEGGHGRRKIYAGINPLGGTPDKSDGVFDNLSTNPHKNEGVTPTKMRGVPHKNEGDIKKENKKENSPPKAPQGAAGEIWDPEAFERFWAAYPKKKDKAKAITEWNRLKADRKLMREMSAALRRQKASEEWQRDNGRAIPYPCRWLSHRRWEDEDIVPAAAPPAPRREAELWI